MEQPGEARQPPVELGRAESESSAACRRGEGSPPPGDIRGTVAERLKGLQLSGPSFIAPHELLEGDHLSHSGLLGLLGDGRARRGWDRGRRSGFDQGAHPRHTWIPQRKNGWRSASARRAYAPISAARVESPLRPCRPPARCDPAGRLRRRHRAARRIIPRHRQPFGQRAGSPGLVPRVSARPGARSPSAAPSPRLLGQLVRRPRALRCGCAPVRAMANRTRSCARERSAGSATAERVRGTDALVVDRPHLVDGRSEGGTGQRYGPNAPAARRSPVGSRRPVCRRRGPGYPAQREAK